MEVTVYESLKEGKGKPVNFFAVSSICLFTSRTIWSSHKTQYATHSQNLCVDTSSRPLPGQSRVQIMARARNLFFPTCAEQL